MPSTIIFTGSPGAGVTIAACAAAIGDAAGGQRTLLLSLGSAAGMGALLGLELGSAPTRAIAGLDVLAPDPVFELNEVWEKIRQKLPPEVARIAADELPLLPGAPALFALLRLPQLREEYDRVVIDAGAHDALLLALGLPDTARWLIRMLLGLDRGPGQNRASVSHALLPAEFLPAEVLGGVQDIRVQLERARAQLIDPATTAACYVLRPDSYAVAEARLAVPALQLHGLSVASIAIGPLDEAGTMPDEAAMLWPSRPWVPFTTPNVEGLAGLAGIAPELAGCFPVEDPPLPIREQHRGTPALAIELPGLPKGALGLTLAHDELIVRVGPYRRHVLLPDSLRAASAIRATREGDLLVIRRRE
jgi:anion-transporting  ArsA/GET3 family ATPase